MSFGGPYLGIMACREEFVRRMPGRLVGQTVDRRGKRCWVLTLQTREQHIRREKATSNICTNQGLLALRAAVYLAAMGPGGLRDVAELCLHKARYAAERLRPAGGSRRPSRGRRSRNSSCACPAAASRSCSTAALRQDIFAGVPLGRWYPELADCLLVAVTEKRTKAEIDRLAALTRADAEPEAASDELPSSKTLADADRAGAEHLRTMRNTQRDRTAVRTLQARLPLGAAAGVRRAGAARRRTAAGRGAGRRAAAAAGIARARDRAALRQPLDAQHVGRYELLSAGLLYDEVQSQAERAAGRPAGHGRPASLSAARRRCKACSNCSTTRSRCSPRSPACRRFRCSRRPARTAS